MVENITINMEKVRKKEGIFILRPDRTLIAGFYRGDNPRYSSENKVWCVKCKDNMPESTKDNPVNPIVYRFFDDYSGEECIEPINNVKCSKCREYLPVD